MKNNYADMLSTRIPNSSCATQPSCCSNNGIPNFVNPNSIGFGFMDKDRIAGGQKK